MGGDARRSGSRRIVLLAVLAVVVALAGGPVAAGPPHATTSAVEDLIATCPSSAEIAAFNTDVSLSFEADPTVGTLVCHASDGSADLTRFQERVYQALRVMKAISFTRPLPWTAQPLYDWFVGSIDGIRFRNDIQLSFCCDPANVIDIVADPNGVELFTNRWMATPDPIGLRDFVDLLVHEARHNNGKPHTCTGGNDQTVGELGAWGTVFYLELWEALYSGKFLTAPDPYPSYYRQSHIRGAESYLVRICEKANADLSLSISAPSPDPAVRARRVTYRFTVSNAGPDAADDVYAYSAVPAATTFAGATTSQGSCTAAAGGPVACSFGPIPSGGSATADITFRVDASTALTQITNREAPDDPLNFGASVTAPVSDPNELNNRASFTTQVVRRKPH